MGRVLDLLQEAYEIYDKHDWEAIQAGFETRFQPDFEVRNPIGRFRGGEVLALWQAFLTAFPDVSHEVVSSVEQADAVCVEGTYSGTHTGPLRLPDGSEVPPTGKAISLEYTHVARLEGDRFSSWHVYFDSAAMMQQLGLAPEPAQV